MGVVKGNEPLSIFKDMLAFASINQIDNMFYSMITGEDTLLQIKNIDIKAIQLKTIEKKVRRFCVIFIFSLTNFVAFTAFFIPNIYSFITNSPSAE